MILMQLSDMHRVYISLALLKMFFCQHCATWTCFLLWLRDVISNILFWRADLMSCFVKALALSSLEWKIEWGKFYRIYIWGRFYICGPNLLCDYGNWKGEGTRGGLRTRSSPTSPTAEAFNCTFTWACF